MFEKIRDILKFKADGYAFCGIILAVLVLAIFSYGFSILLLWLFDSFIDVNIILWLKIIFLYVSLPAVLITLFIQDIFIKCFYFKDITRSYELRLLFIPFSYSFIFLIGLPLLFFKFCGNGIFGFFKLLKNKQRDVIMFENNSRVVKTKGELSFYDGGKLSIKD